MSNPHFDKIVIGGGLAGLCCAGELAARGERPLLISETNEVGAVFPVQSLGGDNTFFLQMPLWQLGWGGGWWAGLARRLNIPLKVYHGFESTAYLRGMGQFVTLPPFCVTASTFADVLLEAFPFPMEGARSQLEKVLERALNIPWEELLTMQQVPFAGWLADNGADEMISTMLLVLGGAPSDLTLEYGKEYLSVLGGLGSLRTMLCGEGFWGVVYPNTRDGLCVPLARAVGDRGGAVWRGRKVQRVLVEDGAVKGVRFDDGTEVEAPVVALACGNHRTGAFLDPLPPEIVKPLEHSKGLQMEIFTGSYLLERPVFPAGRGIAVFDPSTMSVAGWTWAITEVAPWTTEPGKQIVGSHVATMSSDVDPERIEEQSYARMAEINEELCPGFADAIIERRRHKARNGWMGPVTVGPKLPRTVDSVEGLWFVSDESEPCRGLWAEGAASAGILAARAMPAGARNSLRVGPPRVRETVVSP